METSPLIFYVNDFFDQTRQGKLILNHLIGNNCPESCSGLVDSYFFKLTFRSDCLDLCFWAVSFKTILTQ